MTKRLFAFLISLVLVFTTIAPVYAADSYDFTLSLSGGSEYKQGDQLTVAGTATKNGNVYPGVAVSIKLDAKSYDARMYSNMIFADAQGKYAFTSIDIDEEYIQGAYVVSVNVAGMIKTLEFNSVEGQGGDEASAQISPTNATFDKRASEQEDIEVTMTLDSTELSSIKRGTEVLTGDTDYTVSDDKVTIMKDYLAALATGQYEFTFEFTNDAEACTLTIKVIDTTPVNTISPTSATFDKRTIKQENISVTISGSELNNIKNGTDILSKGTDYTVTGKGITIKKQYLNSLSIGTTLLTFDFLEGNDCILTVNIKDTTPDKDNDKSSKGKSSGGSSSTTQQPTASVILTPVLNKATGEAIAALSAGVLNNTLSSAKADANGMKQIIVNIASVQNARAYKLELPSQFIASGAETARSMILMNTSLGTVSIPDNMLTPDLAALGGTVGISLGLADTGSLPAELKAKIGDRPVYDLNLEVNGAKKDWSNPNAPVTVSVNYTPTAEELSNPDGIVIWYLDPVTNTPVAIPNCKYDPSTGKVTFTVTHFSKYAVAYVKTVFNDIDGYAWARKQISTMAAKGILMPVSENEFNPGASITRAEFMYGLVRSLGLTTNVDDNFSDIKPADYYYTEIGIAKKLGITSGVGDNKFKPDTVITRQDMMTLIVKALEVSKKLKATNSTDLNKFEDNKIIASYARQSVAVAVAEGIVAGDGKNVNPLGNTTRAEAAVILYRIFNK